MCAYVQAAMSKEDLLQVQTQEILNNFYDGKFGNFFAALMGSSKVTEEDTDRLDALLEELKNKQ